MVFYIRSYKIHLQVLRKSKCPGYNYMVQHRPVFSHSSIIALNAAAEEASFKESVFKILTIGINMLPRKLNSHAKVV